MAGDNDPVVNESDSDSIYRAPQSPTAVAPQGDLTLAYIGPKNTDYYARKFEKFQSGGGSISWNWPAFFISSVWLLYRKMWLLAFLYWIVLPFSLSFLSTFVTLMVDASPIAGELAYYGLYFLIAFILLPMFANRLYFAHAKRKADKVAGIISSEEQQAIELARIGGTSNVALVVAPLFIIMLIGILAAIAIPAYQDYTIRAQVSEGLNLAGGAKAAVTEYYQDTGSLPADNMAAGLADPQQISGNYVASIFVDDGVIVVTYGGQAHTILSGNSIVLSPDTTNAGVITWDCGSATIQPKHLPAACR
ncbi:MAG: pilin [Woeseiaceae bacterium]|jgi:type IV pilus assembly protein PilA